MQSSVSSSSRKVIEAAAVWLCRLLVGGAFALGGWAKSVDPYGTLYKLLEYLNVWGLHAFPREPVIMAAVALGALEFTIGACVLFGVLRRSSAVAATIVMCFMLPLTAYIAVANPVADCGCFGDVLVLGNTATFFKNIVLAAACVYLLKRNTRVAGFFAPAVQWLVVTFSVIYALVLAAVGYNVQPVVDFRPYPLGTFMAADAGESIQLVFEKDGVQQNFSEDELPDSSWTYLGPVGDVEGLFPVFDPDGEEAEVFETDGEQLIFIVPEPDEQFLTRSRFANELAGYAQEYGVSSAAIIGAGADGLREWVLLAAPDFDVYSADDTDLKALVRGDIAAVYMRDGRIAWKRNMASLSTDMVETAVPGENSLETVSVPDSGRLALIISCCYVGLLLLLLFAKYCKKS